MGAGNKGIEEEERPRIARMSTEGGKAEKEGNLTTKEPGGEGVPGVSRESIPVPIFTTRSLPRIPFPPSVLIRAIRG